MLRGKGRRATARPDAPNGHCGASAGAAGREKRSLRCVVDHTSKSLELPKQSGTRCT